MMKNQFSQRVTDILNFSKEEAFRLRNDFIGPEHLLLGLIREGDGKAIDLLTSLHVDLKDIKSGLEDILKMHPNMTDDTDHFQDLNFNEQASRVLKLCILESKLFSSLFGFIHECFWHVFC